MFTVAVEKRQKVIKLHERDSTTTSQVVSQCLSHHI